MKAGFIFDGHNLEINFDTGEVTGADEQAVNDFRDGLRRIAKKGTTHYRLAPSIIDYPVTDPFRNPKEFVACAQPYPYIKLSEAFDPYFKDIYYELCPGELRPEEYAKLSPEEKKAHDSLEILY